MQALAHALDYLKPFGLDAVLRCGAAFRPFAAAGELQLSPNALAQLEVLRNSDDGEPRGCASLPYLGFRSSCSCRPKRWCKWRCCVTAMTASRAGAPLCCILG